MKPIRDYSEGQWLLLMWGFVVFFLVTGLFLGSKAVVAVSILGGAGAGYTTFLYVQQHTSPRPNGDTHEGDNR
jgi:hypothetical protein